MSSESGSGTKTRTPLSEDRVLRGAVSLADERGIDALTMRNLAEDLGVEAMSLYYHVANKEALLDGIVDIIGREIEEAVGGFSVPADEHWKAALRTRILTARSVMLAHPWAPGVLESRTTMSMVLTQYFDSLLGIMREGGFSNDLGHHALHALGSRALGFSQELFNPADDTDSAVSSELLKKMASQLPYIMDMLGEVAHDDPDGTIGWCDDQSEFTFAVDLLLDGLERRVAEQ
jgi:AcrR family transcriptional regulator